MLAIRDWLAIIGISSLIATALGHWLSKSREYDRWAYENRKQEWRELIDQMHVILERMRYFHDHLRKDILEDINEGARLLESRLFIGEALEKQDINKKFGELVNNTFGSEESERVPETEFLLKTLAFQHELVSVAQNDLKLKKVGRWGILKPKT
jgi:hypothetical protein